MPIDFKAVFVTAILLVIFLAPAALSVWLTKRFTHFPYWGLSFLLFWIVPVALILAVISLVYRL